MYKNGLITTIWNWCRIASLQFYRQKLLTANDTMLQWVHEDRSWWKFFLLEAKRNENIWIQQTHAKILHFPQCCTICLENGLRVQFMSQMWQVIQDLWTSNEYASEYICLIFFCSIEIASICNIYILVYVKRFFCTHTNKFPSENMLRMNGRSESIYKWKCTTTVHSVRCDCMTVKITLLAISRSVVRFRLYDFEFCFPQIFHFKSMSCNSFSSFFSLMEINFSLLK